MKNVLIFLVLLITLGLIAVVLFVYIAFNGNLIDSYRSRLVMEQYLAETYPGNTFAIQSVTYDAKFGRYQAHVVDGAGRTFTLAGDPEGVQYDQYHWTFNMDQPLTDRIDAQLKKALAELLGPAFPQYRGMDTGAYVPVDTLPADAQFVMGMEQEWRFEIYLVGPDMGEDNFVVLSMSIRDALLAAGYHPKAMRFLYNQPEGVEGKGGMLYYTLTIQEEDYAKTAAELHPGVEAFNMQHRK